MITRYFMLFSTLILVSACAGNNKKNEVETDIGQIEDIDFDADSVYSEGAEPIPGSQADLVVNVGDRIFFETDSSSLTSSARTTLENQATWLANYQSVGVAVEGHADERGTREYNLALGERRANTIRNYLVALGVSPARITTISFGKERPAVPGSNQSVWSQNRRGVTKVQ